MDPQPSNFGNSEKWSDASSSVIDTRSEPPRCYGRDAEKIRMKHVGASPASASGSLSGTNQHVQNTPVATLTTKLSNNSSIRSISNNSSRSRDPKAAESSQEASASASTSDGRSKKSKNINKNASSASTSRQDRASASSTNGHSHNHSGRGSSDNRRNSRDPEESTLSTNPRSGYASNSSSQALVPMAPPPRPTRHQRYVPQSNLDPPEESGASTSGSSSSTECNGNQYDPPSTNSISQQSPTYAKVYAPNHEQLAVWSEGADEDQSTHVSQSIQSERSRMMETTLASRRSSQSTSESSYSDEEEDSATLRSEGVTAIEGGGELASAVGRALAIREESQSEGGTSTEDDEGEDDMQEFKDARALVQSDYHGGVNSCSQGEYDNNNNGALITKEDDNRYLSNAVDNHQAIVPIDSTLYEAYDHTFVTCPEHLRFRFLYTFVKKNLDKKIILFFSTANSAKFHAKLLGHFHIPGVLTMHGKQSREKFIHHFFKFSDLDTGILCATDAAGRDLDIPPSVDWVVQFEPPDDPSEYILRVARISCDSDRVGRSLLFLNPGEQGFLKYYHSASIPVSEFEIPTGKLADVQTHIEYHVNESERLLRLARDAYGSYLIAYASHGFRDVYNVHDLNKHDVASAFGLVGLPAVMDDLTMETDTLAVSSYGGGGGGGGVPTSSRTEQNRSSSSRKKTWEKTKKPQTKTWMTGEKSWPHSQIKMHPKFKEHDADHPKFKQHESDVGSQSVGSQSQRDP